MPKKTANGTRKGREISGISDSAEKYVETCQANKNMIAMDEVSETIGSSRIDSENIRKYSKKKYGDCKAPLERTVYVAINANMHE